jgi:hypothetical protein
MKKIVLTFGFLSGAILAGMMAITLPLSMSGAIRFENMEIIGYTTMVLAFLLVFFGIRSYRENVAGGAVTFGRAVKVGVLITLIACAMYVISWEIIYYNFTPDFVDKYATATLEKMRAKGASEAAIAKTTQEMASFKVLYANPFFNVGMTFMEVFPVGLLMTLISAAILRRRPDASMTPRVSATAGS